MKNYLITFGVILLAILSLSISTNLSVLSRTSEYLKEDIEIAVHDASLQIDKELLAEGKIVFDQDRAIEVFKESMYLNTGMNQNDYEIIDMKFFDHSNSTFPVTYQSNRIDFSDVFLHPTMMVILKTSTDKYFSSKDPANFIRVASYSYQLNGLDDSNFNLEQSRITGMYWVVPYTKNISSYYSKERLHPIDNVVSAHKGIDISDEGILNTPVVSALDGVVQFAGNLGSYGNMIQISHDNGLITRYAHLSSINVTKGESVFGGQVIGLVGSTGKSTAPHLHFETIYNGKHIDPLLFY